MIVFVSAGARSNAASFNVTRVSLSVIPLTVTLPLLVTTTVYVISSLTATLAASLSPTFAVFSTVSSASAATVVTPLA